MNWRDLIDIFLADIPTNLIEAFRATLNDAIDAHLIIHVCDISHPDNIVQRKIVLKTLQELNVPPSKLESMITVYNKSDLLNEGKSTGTSLIEDEEGADDDDNESDSDDNQAATDTKESSDVELKNDDDLLISCKTGQGLDRLLGLIQEKLLIASDRITYEYRVLQGGELYRLLSEGNFCTIEQMVVDESNPQFIRLKCIFSKASYGKFRGRYAAASKYQINSDERTV